MDRLLALGDSYTVGEGVDPADSWPRQLADRLQLEPTVVATTGWTSGDLLAALDSRALEGPFQLVSVSIGVNDQYQGLPRSQFVRNLTILLVRAARLASAGVFVVSIPDWGVTPFAVDRDRQQIAAEIEQYNRNVGSLAAARGIPVVDVTSLSRATPGAVVEDGLHPSPEQYLDWVEAITPVARNLLMGNVSA